eukprot:12682192-Alexandrium_andersonii.AAC.1
MCARALARQRPRLARNADWRIADRNLRPRDFATSDPSIHVFVSSLVPLRSLRLPASGSLAIALR